MARTEHGDVSHDGVDNLEPFLVVAFSVLLRLIPRVVLLVAPSESVIVPMGELQVNTSRLLSCLFPLRCGVVDPTPVSDPLSAGVGVLLRVAVENVWARVHTYPILHLPPMQCLPHDIL